MKVFKTPGLKYIFFLELALVASFLFSLLVFLVYNTLRPPPEYFGDSLHQLYDENISTTYGILNRLLIMPVESPPEEGSVNSKFIAARGQLDEIEKELYRSRPDRVYQLITRIPRDFALVRQEREYLYFKWLYQNRRYEEFIRDHSRVRVHRGEMDILLLNCLVMTGQAERGMEIFKEVLLTGSLRNLQGLISSSRLKYLMSGLEEEYWEKNLFAIISNVRFREFLRIKNLIGYPELVSLMQGLYRYRQRDFERTRINLARVKNERFLPYKHAVLAKMAIRDDIDRDISAHLGIVRRNDPAYRRLLLNLGKLYFLNHRPRRSMKFLTDLRELLETDTPTDQYLYYDVVWMNIGNHFREGWGKSRREMLDRLSRGAQSPRISIRSACEYWISRIHRKNNTAPGYPYHYYSLLGVPPWRDLYFSGVKSFLNLIRGVRRSEELEMLISEVNQLTRYGLVKDIVRLLEGEIRYSDTLNPPEKRFLRLVMAVSLVKAGKYHQAFVTFAEGIEDLQKIIPPRFLKDIYFPRAYSELVEKYAEVSNLERAIVYSIIREESFYNTNALSYAGASGLMQLMPGTARRMLRPGEGPLRRGDLYQPDLNIRLGTRYLRFLLDRYRQNLVLALGAYNAGTDYVDGWVSAYGRHPREEFIEAIPVQATRAYVKKILRDYFFYRFYYNDQQG